MNAKPKHTPTPAELVTFARMAGWKVTKKELEGLPLIAWTWYKEGREEIGKLMYYWNEWGECIAEAQRQEDDQRAGCNNRPSMSIQEAMRDLGTTSRKTLKSWFMATRGGDQCLWKVAIDTDRIADWRIQLMKRERDSRQTQKARKASLARHGKSS